MNESTEFTSKLTGIELLDRAIPPDHNVSGVHAVLGPSGSGITKLACMITAEGIRRESKTANEGEGECGQWVFVSRQTPKSGLQQMIGSYLGMLNLERMERGELKCIDPANNPDMQLEYANSFLKSGFIHIDANQFPVGWWGTPSTEIANQLEIQLGAKPLAGLMIDDVPSMIDSWRSDVKNSGAGFTRLMDYFLSDCQKIASENDCPVWIGHQIRGAESSKLPLALITHREAMGYKHMDKYIKTGFVIGNHDKSGAFQIRCTKPYTDCEELLAVVRFGGGGTYIEEVDLADRTLFLTESWKQPSLMIHSDVLDIIQEDRDKRLEELRKPESAPRMVRAIDF